jgi:hypothetical protein
MLRFAGVPMTTLDFKLREQLIEYARNLAHERGWAWLDPVEVSSGAEQGESVWIIRSNVLSRGRNVHVSVRQSDHSLIRAGFLPR